MEIKRNEKTAVNTVELEIAVTGEEFIAARKAAYKKNVGKINVPGFRRGKAPQAIIEKMYGKEVFYEDAVNMSYGPAYEAAIKEAGLNPVAQPDVEIVSLDENGYTFKAVVTTKPEATMGDYKAIRVEKASIEVTDEDVDAAIKRLAERNSRTETVERAVETGDIAVIDFEGFKDGVAFDGGKAEGHELKIGSGSFIPGFEDQIIGHTAGESFDVNVTFPEEYHSEDLKGQAVVFKVTLHEVKAAILPEIDDEFAKDVSECDTLEALRAQEMEKLVKARTSNAEQAFEGELLEKLAEVTEVEIPQAMIENRIDQIAQDFGYRMQMQGISMEQYFQMTGSSEEDFRKGFADRAEHQVKISLALEAIAKIENVEVTDEEIEAEYVKLAGENGKIEQIKAYVPADAMRQDLVAEKIMNMLKESAAQAE